jgi:signal transduction histidine kinase
MLELEFSDEMKKESIKEVLENVQQKTQELSNVIASFQQVVEIKGSKKKRNIKDIISEALKVVELYDKDYLIEEYGETRAFRTYPKELMNAISAILKNAIEATSSKANKFIKIQTFEQNNNVVVKISNNGGHIPDDIIGKIFLPYFSTKNERNGVGLGLYITKTIIELHLKGEIEVFNKDNDIVEFIITLPMEALE